MSVQVTKTKAMKVKISEAARVPKQRKEQQGNVKKHRSEQREREYTEHVWSP